MTYVQSEDTTWPIPDGELEWVMRYGGIERVMRNRLSAASVLSAYLILIELPERTRNRRIRDIRRAMRARKEPTK
jgi:hypothetical protein